MYTPTIFLIFLGGGRGDTTQMRRGTQSRAPHFFLLFLSSVVPVIHLLSVFPLHLVFLSLHAFPLRDFCSLLFLSLVLVAFSFPLLPLCFLQVSAVLLLFVFPLLFWHYRKPDVPHRLLKLPLNILFSGNILVNEAFNLKLKTTLVSHNNKRSQILAWTQKQYSLRKVSQN